MSKSNIENIVKQIKDLSGGERAKLFYKLVKEYPELKETITHEWYPGDDDFEKLR